MKTAFITGANQGLGFGFVEHLLDEEWIVFGGTRKLSPELPEMNNLTWIEIDVSNDVSIEQAVARIHEQISTIDLLINNAGVNKDTATDDHKEKVSYLNDLDRSLLLKMFDINAAAPMIVLQKFLPLLTGTAPFVINISSCRGSFHDLEGNTYGNYGYRASKVALNMFTACTLFDLPQNVQTFAVHPGSVRTAMNPDGSNEPKAQAEKIISIMDNWSSAKNGKFLNFNGDEYPL